MVNLLEEYESAKSVPGSLESFDLKGDREGSNPPSSSGESRANQTSGAHFSTPPIMSSASPCVWLGAVISQRATVWRSRPGAEPAGRAREDPRLAGSHVHLGIGKEPVSSKGAKTQRDPAVPIAHGSQRTSVQCSMHHPSIPNCAANSRSPAENTGSTPGRCDLSICQIRRRVLARRCLAPIMSTNSVVDTCSTRSAIRHHCANRGSPAGAPRRAVTS